MPRMGEAAASVAWRMRGSPKLKPGGREDRRLIEAGADLSLKSEDGKTAKDVVAREMRRLEGGKHPGWDEAARCFERVKEALDGEAGKIKAKPMFKEPFKASPLQIAASRGDEAEARRLLSAGADPDARPGGKRTPTALMIASIRGDAKMAELLSEFGASFREVAEETVADYEYRCDTPLAFAARQGDGAMCMSLIRLGADPTAPSWSSFLGNMNIIPLWRCAPEGTELRRMLKERSGGLEDEEEPEAKESPSPQERMEMLQAKIADLDRKSKEAKEELMDLRKEIGIEEPPAKQEAPRVEEVLREDPGSRPPESEPERKSAARQRRG